MPTTFGQIVIGPPGAGKTTYCDYMAQLLRGLGRQVAIINIDPANEGETLPYQGIVLSELFILSRRNFLGPLSIYLDPMFIE